MLQSHILEAYQSCIIGVCTIHDPPHVHSHHVMLTGAMYIYHVHTALTNANWQLDFSEFVFGHSHQGCTCRLNICVVPPHITW